MHRWVLMAGLLVSGCGGDDSNEDIAPHCERMREHLIELRLADTTAIDRDAHRAAMQSALGKDFVARCVAGMTSREIDCVLEAASTEFANACSRTARH